MAQSRFYSATAQPTVLTAAITPSQTTIVVQQVVGFPASVPYILALDYNSPSEEIVLVTAQAGTSLTVTRAYDSTSAASHGAGAAVRHTWTALDGNDSRAHEGSTAGVHGVTGNVVGTTDSQTLTNKTLGSGTTFSGSVTLNNPNITGTVTGSASYTTITATGPTISGTVGGSATYTTPTLTTPTINGGQWNDAVVRNSAVGVVPLTVNSIASTTAVLAAIANNGTNRLSVTSGGQTTVTSGTTSTTALMVVGNSGSTVDITRIQKGAGTDVVKVDSGGVLHALNGLNAGSTDQFVVATNGNVTTSGTFTNLTATEAETSTTSTTTSTTYADLAAGAFSGTVTVPPSGKVMVSFRATGRNSGANNSLTSFNASGSTSGSVYTANDAASVIAVGTNNISLSGLKLITGLVSGETLTVTLKHRVNVASTATFDYRTIHLQAIGA